MPTYEYACESCKGHFEYFQGMSESAKTVCESCGGKLSRLVGSGSGLVFKGSGFYITDYKPAGAGQESVGSASDAGGSKAAPSEAKGTSSETSASPADSVAPATTTPASSPTSDKP
jgi:putative FmdB family regulatory protein